MKSYLIYTCSVISLYLVQQISADCQHQGKFYMNHTLWLPDHCSICTCLDPVSVCESVQCLSPDCFFSKGEYLQIPSDGCCPECVGTLAPCQHQSKTVPHNAEWNPEPCTYCSCWNGEVTCSAVTCPRRNCKPGTVAQTLPGQCCPQCISSGSSCVVEAKTYEDGEEWSPLPCIKCVCHDGKSSCFPIQCPPLVCPQGQKVEMLSDSCCPVCQSTTCTDRGLQYQNNEQWQRDVCTFCTCLQGQTVCRSKDCVAPKDLECGKIEKKVRRPGECCVECVSNQASCDQENPIRYSGDVWNTSACEYCICENGKVNCHTAMCEPLVCELYQTKVHLEGKCCAECVEPPTCSSAGQMFMEGDTWYPDPCSICSCHTGHVTCYQKSCPACPEGNIAVIRQGECCGICQPFKCDEACSACHPGNPQFCLSCQHPGMLLQNGTCVHKCHKKYYPTRDGKCAACHSSCGSCVGTTQYHCIQCQPGLLWRGGQCVSRCGQGYFQDGRQCKGCHSSCSTCIGPDKNSCLSCSNSGQVLLKGQCVNSCGAHYYVKDGQCSECMPTCLTCSSDGRFCTNCSQSLVLHKGQCLSGCPAGYHQTSQGICLACHPGCETCGGPLESDCLSCADGIILSNQGNCSNSCTDGQFLNTNGQCQNCDGGCVQCQISSDKKTPVCLECRSPMVAFDNICVRQCPIGHYNNDNICERCGSGCVECDNPSVCTRCGPALLLSNGVCVLNCAPSQTIDPIQNTCVDCPSNCLTCTSNVECTQCDDVSYLKEDLCVSRCGSNFLQDTQTRKCIANQHSPSLQIYGQIHVEEGNIITVSASIFSLSDSDTSTDMLVIVIDKLSENGQLVKVIDGKDVPLMKGDKFSLVDLQSEKIRFIHKSGSMRKSKVLLKASDGQKESAVKILHITAIPKYPPYLLKLEPLLAYTGQSTTIDTEHVNVHAESRLQDLSIRILQGPSHGRIINKDHNVPISAISIPDLTGDKIAYRHNGGTESTDMMLIQVSDGYHILNVIQHINIRQKEDVLPMIVHNKVGHVIKGKMLQITSDLLQSKVMDAKNAPSDEIIYTLVPPINNPKEGEIMMVVQQPAKGPGRGWEDIGNGKMSAKMFRFLQRDINEGRIWYQHKGASDSSDILKFEVSDTAKLPNILRDQTFHISVMNDEVTTAVPTIAPGIRLGMSVLEGQIIPISSTNLAFQDSDTEDNSIIYNVTSPLGKDEGSIEHVSHQFRPVSQFTQEDINNNRIIYRPPKKEIGSTEKQFTFMFIVSDGSETLTREQTFTVRLIPVNNEPPRFTNPTSSIKVSAGGSVPLGSRVLAVSDADTLVEDLTFMLTVMPDYGTIEKVYNSSKVFLRQGDTFQYSEILENAFQYQHDKHDKSPFDRFEIQVSDGIHQSSALVNVSIISVDNSAPVMLPVATCRVYVKEGQTVKIERKDLAFTDEDDRDNKISIVLASEVVHGSLKLRSGKALQIGASFTQKNINSGLVRYIADKEIGTQPITEILVFNVSDSRRNVLPNQILSVIIEPVDNQSPVVVIVEKLMVEEGDVVALSLKNLKITDIDTPIPKLVASVIRQPSFGRLISTKSAKTERMRPDPVSVFHLQDLMDGYIIYEQSDHRNKEPAWDVFQFTVTDGVNTCPVQTFNVSITLVNDEFPVLITEQLFVKEDKSVLLTNASLFIMDIDTPPKDLTVTVTSLPSQGVIGKRQDQDDVNFQEVKEGSVFTYQSVLDELILYQHKGGNIKSDSMLFDVTDGDFKDQKRLNVIIGIVSDETPRVSINRGLRINAGSTTFIKSQDLKCTDIDSNDQRLKFIVRRDPPAGHLQYVRGAYSQKISTRGPVKNFLQSDINHGYIQYVHQIGEVTGVIVFKFDVEDLEKNKLIDQDFFITVVEDRHPPQVVSDKELIVKEGSSARISSLILSYTDVDSEPGSLKYFLILAPELGHLELTKNQGVPISEFTQSDLAANSVVYIHTSHKEEYRDAFTYTVTDGTNEVTHTFSITITPVDDEIPVVINNGLTVQEGVRKVITEFDLKVVDKDTGESSLVFSIVHPPKHGSLQRIDNRVYKEVTSFTMSEIYNNKISYQHDGSETKKDNFSFTVTDGATKMFSMQRDGVKGDVSVPSLNPKDFSIEVLPVDDGTPVIHTNLGLQFLEQNSDKISNFITDKELLATDVDTLPKNLVYLIVYQPQHGHLENSANPSRSITSFTQEDVNNQKIRYVLTRKSNSTQDSFTFDLVDSKPNRLSGNVFHIMWCVIEFEHIQINVTETAGIIRVPIHRRGNLKQYSVVSCTTSPGTATSQTLSSRPGGQDFIQKSGQVQFDEWQDYKMCNIIINDDSLYEGPETFYVQIHQPVYALIGDSSKATITVEDEEDVPLLQFNQTVYHVSESDVYLHATVVRSGDVSTSVSVICSTVSLTARGSSLDGLESGSDYISRGQTNSNRVIFPPGVTSAPCTVKLIDDSDFETSEQFEVHLLEPSYHAHLGILVSSTVIIEGPNDESVIHWALPQYHFDEDAGEIEAEIIRSGSDLSHTSVVWCATRLSEPPSATPGIDYIPSSSQVTFNPGQKSERCRLTILDDEVEPTLEGNETFVIWLSTPMGSNLGLPYIATVNIQDSHLDIPRMQFAVNEVTVSEDRRTINVAISRHGDTRQQSSVICYTRQNSATVMMDFRERALTEASRVVFLPNEKVKNCTVEIVDDTENEPTEFFNLHLANPLGANTTRAELGARDNIKVTILNPEDVPRLQFEQEEYTLHEPDSQEHVVFVNLSIIRTGDMNNTASVRCSTRDGSAKSGVDYNAKSEIIQFKPGQNQVNFTVEILHNGDIEWHEALTVVLGPEDPVNAELGDTSVTTITILDDEVSGSLVLPAPPVVVSLLHLDDIEDGKDLDPSPGYPLICVSPCDIRYPSYTITHSICDESGINQSAVSYRWEVAMPASAYGVKPPFVMVTDNTLFTSVNKMVLDSIYFRPSFRVRCIVQPLHSNGNPGIPSKSREVKISHKKGICNSPVFKGSPNIYGAQSFLANLRYIGPDDLKHPNTIHISIKIPHQDGHLPLISTYPIHNLRYLLSNSVYRQQHLCSNLVTPEERAGIVDSGFLDSDDLYPTSYKFPYQFDPDVRENKTVNLYRHLDLKSCMWTFDAWYHMTDLVDVCNGKIVSDFEVKDAGKTYLTIKVPLYVYYVYATAPVGWGSLQHHSEMEFSFYYDTILWNSGLETEGKIAGDLQVLKILVGQDGKLVVDFKTNAKFRGLYVLQHHTKPDVVSRVIPPDGMSLQFDLTVLWTQPTFDSPHQLWRATSNFNLKDYTGTYIVELIPCTVISTQIYTFQQSQIPCTAQTPQRFEVPIAFQQSNRPVPLVYSLDTTFQLTSNKKVFLMDINNDQLEEEMEYDKAFSEGQTVYGRVQWNPDQDLKSAYKLSIQKVYLCAGSDGYVPVYDPEGNTYGEGRQFGCIQPSPKLRYRFLILDRGNTDVVQKDFLSIPFNAEFAQDNAEYQDLERYPGVDGFSLSVDPLYKVTSGNQWYLQVIYIITKSDSTGQSYLFKRAVDYIRQKREITSLSDILQRINRKNGNNGTNIQHLPLFHADVNELEKTSVYSPVVPVIISFILILVCFIIGLVTFFIFRRKRRKKRSSLKQEVKLCNLDIAAQNSMCQRKHRNNSLSQSRINVNITEIKDTAVSICEKDQTAQVKIKNTNIHTQGKNKLTPGTEV